MSAHNILLNDTQSVKISDYCLSSIPPSVTKLKWMSPESISNKIYSTKSDIWGFGVVLFEIATKSEPHPQLEPLQAASQIVFTSNSICL